MEQCKQTNKRLPLGEGVLILDEVKVIGKVAWNSKNGKLVGIEMDRENIPSLLEFGKELSDDNRSPAEYYLQFLWRDLSSNFDVIGPHYSSSKTMDAKFTHACMLNALTTFEAYNFRVGGYKSQCIESAHDKQLIYILNQQP